MTPKQREQRGRWLLAAFRNRRYARAEQLIHEGADLSVRDPDGSPMLYTALVYGAHALVPLLLERGADPNIPGPYDCYPIHLAAEWEDAGAAPLLEDLVRHGARIDVRDDEGATPVFVAGKQGTAAAIYTLQRLGADISERNTELDTSLAFAACWGMTERAELLLNAGIDVHSLDSFGMNALAWAARGGHAEVVALLLQRGARPEVPDHQGWTPLFYAALHGSLRCVALLLEAGSDPRRRDEHGRSALDLALPYAGKDLATALLAEMTEDRPGPDAAATRLVLERGVSPSGEPTVTAIQRDGAAAGEDDEYTSGRSLEKCDCFDAVVELLLQASAVA